MDTPPRDPNTEPRDPYTGTWYRRYWGYYNRPFAGFGCLMTILIILLFWWLFAWLFAWPWFWAI